MTDIAYRCRSCRSVHEVEPIRENLIVDLRTAASYGLSGRRGMLDPRDRFLRWRITRGLTRALWPRVPASSVPGLGQSAGAAEARAPADRPDSFRAAAGGRDVRRYQVISFFPVPVADWPAPDALASSPRTDLES